ncbi:MAG: lysylphosphatidylglycerol synthase transmembrane domain-containing protein [Myxococcota bacterium]|nr:lysylphosphatidylglycerol synthase transmembrane domain-containing protein [Myxococcota bacterium]
MSEPSSSGNLIHRFRHWVIGAIAFGAVLYLVGAVWAGLDQVGAELRGFRWGLLVPVVLLTLLNYTLRFVKWHYLLGRLDVRMPLREDAWNFAAGLAMVISPGKAGELLKPYVVRERTGTPMATTIPALITERLTDGIAMLILAGLGVATYAADKVHYLTIPAVLTVVCLGVLAHRGLSMKLLALGARVPGLGRIVPKLEEMYLAMRTCLAPVPLVWTVFLSVVAWEAECVGFMLVFEGLGIDAGLGVCTFIYAFATVAGGAMPGGLGVADGALAGGAVRLIGGVSEPVAVAAALLVRVATLWIGVFLGALALVVVSRMLGGSLSLEETPAVETDP